MLKGNEQIIEHVRITEEDNDRLSILDIKAAIAEQNIPVAELFSKQDLASNNVVLTLVHEAEQKAKTEITKKNVILEATAKELRLFKDRTDTLSLIKTSKNLANKEDKTIEYIKARLATGRGVDLTGDLTNDQRQDKVNTAIEEELTLIDEQGIVFKSKKEKKDTDKNLFDDDEQEVDYTDPKNNPLIPTDDDDSD